MAKDADYEGWIARRRLIKIEECLELGVGQTIKRATSKRMDQSEMCLA